MARKITVATRGELLRAIGERYRASARKEKLRILDEFVALTGYHRKHAIRVLKAESRAAEIETRRPRLRLYDEAVRAAVIVLWEASDRVCGKRLRPLLSVLVPALERHGHLQLDKVVREHVLAASAATLDRLLTGTRAAINGERSRPRAMPGVRRSIPVRTFADWKESQPGYMEADLVFHSGDDVSGSFVHTLTLTDIASGWTECVALPVRDGALIVDALEHLRTTMPFRLRGFDTDNGGEFVNEPVLNYCARHGIVFTRSRPYRKNDQAWVEQKNGSVVRRLVGYRRLEGLGAAQVLARLYAASRLFVNFFQPSFKLLQKIRIGARVKKTYLSPQTPCARLLSLPAMTDEMKERLRAVALSLDPLSLLDEIRAMQHQLAGLAAGTTMHVVSHRGDQLEEFLKSLATAWQEGEVRATHRTEPKPVRDWRTRKDPFENVWPRVCEWLEADPDRVGKELFRRLQAESPGAFHDGQLRTLQRRIRLWRAAAARQLVFAASTSKRAESAAG